MANKEEKAKKEISKNKKSFFKDFKAELKRVNWPTPKQLVNNTIAVITIVIITAVIVFALDIVFETINKHGVDKIKEVVGTNNTVSNETATDNNNTQENAEDNTNTTTGVEETEGDTTTSSEENTTAENSVE